jgi:hypothetical protein
MFLKLEQILIDETLYPRNQINWRAILELMDALRVGDELPAIIVGRRAGKYVVIDGRHRWEAHRRLKRDKIAAMVTRLSEDQWFAEAVRRNTTHGRGLSYQEKIAAAMELRRRKMADSEISQIIRIPALEWDKAVKERGLWDRPDDIKPIVAKGGIVSVLNAKGRAWFKEQARVIDEEQMALTGVSARRLAEELLIILENDLQGNDEETLTILKKLFEMLEKFRGLA